MGQRDDRIDAYIASSADFARPILEHLRKLVHKACPDVAETMKWSRPHFQYKGMLCGMSAFQEHCAFGFWKGSLILGKPARDEPSMGQFGRITRLADLPPDDVLIGTIHQAMKLNDEGVKSPARSKPKIARELIVPEDLAELLSTHDEARSTFAQFPPGQRREYVDWINEAKTPATRSKRLVTTLDQLAEGKRLHWKYQNC